MKCEKCEKEGKAYALRWKSLRMRVHFWTTHNVKIWRYGCLSRQPCALFALLGAAAVVLIVVDADFTALRLRLRSVLRQVLALCSLLPRLKCEKCEKEGKAYALRWKSSRMWARFRTAQNAKIWWFLKTTTRFICYARHCCSLSYSSFSMRTSQRWGCIYILSSPFSRQAPSSFFLAPITTFAILTSWQWDHLCRYSAENDKHT